MASNGLNRSIWANTGSGNGDLFRQPEDWNCPSCGFSNFQWRKDCYQCTSRSSSPAHGTNSRALNGFNTPGISTPPSANGSSGWQNPSTPLRASQASAQMDVESYLQQAVKSGAANLSTSRWAPRNLSGKPRVVSSDNVWIKVPPTINPSPSSRSRNNSPVRFNPHDLGLPYEVQHYILAMMQRILEEGCYDFASRWLPNQLNERNWTCSEAVELSNWKKFLPSALPYNAIVQVLNYSLERGLNDAVRIRNSAVHRHLCDNAEIRRMAKQAGNLMVMFSDVTREGKFHRLWAELNDWDNGNQENRRAARSKLEQALQEIGERPMDDMDWTPNAVSLEEIKDGVEDLQQAEEVDAMDVDY